MNADDATAGIAAGLGVRQTVFMTDVDGIRGADGRSIATIYGGEAEDLIASGVITGGMIPKVRAAIGRGRRHRIRGGHRGRLGAGRAGCAPSRMPTFGTRIVGRAGPAGSAG